MAQTRGLSQSKEALLKSYTKRLKDDVKSILDNFTEIIKSSKVLLFSLTIFMKQYGYRKAKIYFILNVL